MADDRCDDLTIPEPGSTTARTLMSRSLPRLLAALPGLPVPAELRAGHAALLHAVREGLQRAPGAVWSALRQTTVGTLIRCARTQPTPALLCELDATLAAELALAGVLTAPIVVRAPPRIVCLSARRVFMTGPGVVRCAAGELTHHAPTGATRTLWPGGGEPGHLAITDTLALARVDSNPLAEVEAHPDKHGNALDLGGRAPEVWIAALREALAIIERHLPALRGEIDVVLQQVVPVGYDEQRHLSASYQEAIGTVYLSLHPNPMTMAEALIHEFSHNKLHALLELGPALENAFTPLYASPVRPDPRPLHGVLLAVHAFLPVARLYELLLATGERPELRARYREIVAGNHEAATTLHVHARPTAMGAPLLAEIRRWDRHFAGD